MGTSVERTSNVIDIYKLADGYEMPADAIDGMIPEECMKVWEEQLKGPGKGWAYFAGNKDLSVQRPFHQ